MQPTNDKPKTEWKTVSTLGEFTKDNLKVAITKEAPIFPPRQEGEEPVQGLPKVSVVIEKKERDRTRFTRLTIPELTGICDWLTQRKGGVDGGLLESLLQSASTEHQVCEEAIKAKRESGRQDRTERNDQKRANPYQPLNTNAKPDQRKTGKTERDRQKRKQQAG